MQPVPRWPKVVDRELRTSPEAVQSRGDRMSSWETGDEDRAAGSVLSPNAAPWSWYERPTARSQRWRCCIRRSVRSTTSTGGPKSRVFCCGMTVLYHFSATLEVPAAPICRLSRVPSPLMQRFHCVSARPRGRAARRPAWRWPTRFSTPPKPTGDGSTATGSSRSAALVPTSSTEHCKKRTTTNGSLRMRRLRPKKYSPQLLGHNSTVSRTCPCGAEHQMGLQDVRHYRTVPWRAAGRSGLLWRIPGKARCPPAGISIDITRSRIYKTVKSPGQEGYRGSTNGRPRPRWRHSGARPNNPRRRIALVGKEPAPGSCVANRGHLRA